MLNKKIFLVIAKVLFAIYFSYSQTIDSANFRCLYNLKYKIDLLDLERQQTDEMLLLIGTNTSSFYSYKNFQVDSLRKVNPAEYASTIINDGEVKRAIPARTILRKTDNDYTILINHRFSNLTFMGKILTNNYQYEESLKKILWNINNTDTCNLLGYNCQKATTTYKGRKWTVWFTPEIPIGEGPWLLRGLPGLILKAEDENLQYVFNCIEFRRLKVKEPIIKDTEKNYKLTNKKDYSKLRKNFFEDAGAIISEFLNLTPVFTGDGEKPKHKYNPIELSE